MSCDCDIANKSFRAEFRADDIKNVRLVNRVFKNLISMLYYVHLLFVVLREIL